MVQFFLLLLLMLFLICLHPLQKTLTLILFVLLILTKLGLSSSHWVCYLLALVYFGGVLILFTYISSVVPNFSPNTTKLIIPMTLSIIIPFFSDPIINPPHESFNSMPLSLSLISSNSSSFMIYFLLSMILLLLVASISILSNFKSPLRNI